jgi:hypothetical protein
MFELNKKDALTGIYKEIGDEVRAQYRLTFALDKTTGSDGYHRVVLTPAKANPKEFSIQTRDGYYVGEE